jgi:hypothetical protein
MASSIPDAAMADTKNFMWRVLNDLKEMQEDWIYINRHFHPKMLTSK